jgi:hypothetical protein
MKMATAQNCTAYIGRAVIIAVEWRPHKWTPNWVPSRLSVAGKTNVGCPINEKRLDSGLPDSSWYTIPKQNKIYLITIKDTKSPQKIPNGRKVDQMAIKCTNNFHCKDPPKFTQTGILGLKTNHLATQIVLKVFFFLPRLTRRQMAGHSTYICKHKHLYIYAMNICMFYVHNMALLERKLLCALPNIFICLW